MYQSLDEFEIRPDPTTGFHGNREYYNFKNGVSTFSRLLLMGSFSYLKLFHSGQTQTWLYIIEDKGFKVGWF